MKIGVNLIISNLKEHPFMFSISRLALLSLLNSDLILYDYKLAVIDNASTDETLRWIKSNIKDNIDIIMLSQNEGIARSRNIGNIHLLNHHNCDYIVEIHNDHIFPKIWLSPLIEIMKMDKEKKVGMVCSALITPKGFWGSPVYNIQDDAILNRGVENIQSEVTDIAQKSRRDKMSRGLQHPFLKRKEAYLPYNEEFEGSNFEDVLDLFMIEKQGYKSLVTLRSFVYHSYHKTRIILTKDKWNYYYYHNKKIFDNKLKEFGEDPVVWKKNLEEDLKKVYQLCH